MPLTTTTEISAPVNRVLMERFLRRAKPLCTYFAGSMSGELRSHRGSFTVLWRRYENFTPTTSALTELSGTISIPLRTSTQVSVTDVTATISKYGQFIELTEEADLLNPTNQEAELIDVLATSSGRSLNRLQRDVVDDNSTLIRAGNAAADADVADIMSLGLIRNAVNVLDRNATMPFTDMTTGSQNEGTSPIVASYWLQCHSDVAIDVSGLPGFKGVETYAGQTETVPGEFGFIRVAGTGVRCVTSPEATIDTGSGSANAQNVRATNGVADLYTSVIYGMDAHGAVSLDVSLPTRAYRSGERISAIELISKPKGSAGVLDPYNEVATLAWKARHAGAILNGNFIRGLRTAATLLS